MWRAITFLLPAIAVLGIAHAGPIDGTAPLLDERIIGGQNTHIGNHPYQVSLRLDGHHFCGGSIIGQKLVLTAAHCIFKDLLDKYEIQYGVTNVASRKNLIKVTDIITHENFDTVTIDYDVALVILATPIPLGANAKIIALASNNPAAGTNAIVSGWGQADENGPTVQILKRLTAEVVAQHVCQEKYREIDDITSRMICAGLVGGEGTCGGDSGGPLVENSVQVGIVSWGVGCAHPDFPGVYSSVANLRDWIDANSP
ncbi:vitellin-degrading protease [Zeugodacus cucurbitae]|uniref:vitellin-degrading protease n=1 Tax=Zeugodacus cucurbitae TaxID=28588 RepID=UPI0023D93F91|nr:vitellin-degrading protease [Zeugodacus cucurbitae]